MANEEQLALLKQGVEVWNAWREKNPDIEINLSGADLREIDLYIANLSGADLRQAQLEEAFLSEADLSKAILIRANLRSSYFNDADFSQADLSQADFSRAKLRGAIFREADLWGANLYNADLHDSKLYKASLRGANLQGADLRKADLREANLLRADLSNANLRGAELAKAHLRGADLRNAYLNEANLYKADLFIVNLYEADLSAANFSEANLRRANLVASQVLGTNFEHADFTGACIEDWQIGSSTNLNFAICDYIFRTWDEKNRFSGRLPVDPKSTFAPGEFTQRFQIIASALETIDITFTDGIDWQAFFQSFQDLRRQRLDQDISIQGMERKGQAFIVRLEVEADVDKAAIETQIKQLYANQLAALEAQYEERLRLQSEEIAHYRQTQSSLLHIVQTMAEKDPITQNFNAPVGNVAATNHGKMQNIQHIYAPEQQDLSEAAKEIQILLNTLAETYNTNTDAGKEKLMNELDNEVKKHPKWRRALKEGGVELIKLLFPPAGIPLEMARVYLEDE